MGIKERIRMILVRRTAGVRCIGAAVSQQTYMAGNLDDEKDCDQIVMNGASARNGRSHRRHLKRRLAIDIDLEEPPGTLPKWPCKWLRERRKRMRNV